MCSTGDALIGAHEAVNADAGDSRVPEADVEHVDDAQGSNKINTT